MFFPDSVPIGQRIRLTNPNVIAQELPWLTIVGVSPTVRQMSLTGTPDPVVYYPFRGDSGFFARLIVRGAAGAGVTAAIREAMRRLNPDLPLFDPLPLEEALARSGATQTIARHPARRVRRRRPVAGSGRPVCGHRLLGGATDAGDRGTDGARGDGRAGCRFVRSSKRRSAGTRIGNRACRRRARSATLCRRFSSGLRLFDGSHASVRRGTAGRSRASSPAWCLRAGRRGSTHWTHCAASSASSR